MIDFFHSLPPEMLMVGLWMTCLGGIFLFLRFFGLMGLYLYGMLALIVSNIQVLKATQVSFLPEPLALGTVVFSSLFLVTDMVTEYYSPSQAMRMACMGFLSLLLFSFFMVLTIGITPLSPSSVSLAYHGFIRAHEAMKVLFLPLPTLLTASILSYFISQFNDIWIFTLVKKISHARYLWLRTGLSSALSSLLDSFIFSMLAWIILASDPLPFKVVLQTYIGGTYVLRLFMSVVNTPFIYLVKPLIAVAPKGPKGGLGFKNPSQDPSQDSSDHPDPSMKDHP